MADKNVGIDFSVSLDDLHFASEDVTGEIFNNATVMKLNNPHLMRRLASENSLESLVEWELQPGASYHFLSNGDVDSFSYLKFILRQQPLKYLLASTWVIAKQDINEFETYLKLGRLKRLDFYVGEIFPNQYRNEYYQLSEVVRRSGGRVAVFRNHSKVMVGFGEKFNFVIESSANINANPRCENTCITLSTELARFYKDFFDNIRSFNKDFSGWEAWCK